MADALIVRPSTKVEAELPDGASGLLIVGRAGVGLDNIAIEAALARGVEVVNTPQASAISVAEHTFALLLALVRHVPKGDRQFRSGVWDCKTHQGSELFGKTIGIVGLGNIGLLVAQRNLGLGLRVPAADPYVSVDRAQRAGVDPVTFDDLPAKSDIITINVPRNEETIGPFDAEAFAACQPTVLVVNTSRRRYRRGRSGRSDQIRPCRRSGPRRLRRRAHHRLSAVRLAGGDRHPHLAASSAEAQHQAGVATARPGHRSPPLGISLRSTHRTRDLTAARIVAQSVRGRRTVLVEVDPAQHGRQL